MGFHEAARGRRRGGGPPRDAVAAPAWVRRLLRGEVAAGEEGVGEVEGTSTRLDAPGFPDGSQTGLAMEKAAVDGAAGDFGDNVGDCTGCCFTRQPFLTPLTGRLLRVRKHRIRIRFGRNGSPE